MSHAPVGRSSDDIETVLRTTGPRSSAPADLTERVRARVREHWEVDTQKRQRWRRAGLAMALAAAVALVVGTSVMSRPTTVPASAPRAAARVERVFETAWSQTSSTGSPSALHRGDAISMGADIATDDRGRIALSMASGHSVRLDTATRIRLESDRSLALDQGAVYVDSRDADRRAAGSIEIRTPFGIVRDIGTQFEVRSEAGALTVRVREGRVNIDASGGGLGIEAGHQWRRSATGEVTKAAFAEAGQLDWARTVTPMIAINGRSLQQFLEWAARERGLHLEFETPATAAAARTIVLSGSVEGMTVDEAVEAVLATSQLSHRVAENRLRVAALKAGDPR